MLGGRLVSKILGFEPKNVGAIPTLSKIKYYSESFISNNPNSMLPLSLSIRKIRAFLTFFDKKYYKKLVFFHLFINQFNQACNKKDKFFFFFTTSYIVRFLRVLKENHIIFNYQAVPFAYLAPFLLFRANLEFLQRIGLVFFNVSPFYGAGAKGIKLVSRPSRYIYVSKESLSKLLSVRRTHTFTLFVINTTQGILVHSEALKRGVGGNLICTVH